MTIDDVKISIKNHILNSISERDLCKLCNLFTIPISNRWKQNQKNVLDSIYLATDLSLLHHILLMLTKSNNNADLSPAIHPQMRTAVQTFAQNMQRFTPRNPVSLNFSLNLKLYCLSSEIMDKSPIDIRSELVDGVNPQNIFVANFTKYPNGAYNAPSCAPAMINGRMNMPSTLLPYTSKNTTIKSSPFYCCQVVLHPLSLLIPKPNPSICQPNRIMSKMQLNFVITSSVRQLITAHRCQINNKRIYKWQVLLRFGSYDPLKPFPSVNDEIGTLTEYIPPYLSLSVNNETVPLWDILPSNNSLKEGRRHSRPINISDYIKYFLVDEQGYKQTINLNWWQTPGVYLYYYAAVFLERKLDVNELLSQFIKKTHSVQRPISFTLDFIREKFSTNNKFNKKIGDDDNDDDLIMSSVLPVSLQCPVGKSRIECPLRAIGCQHLQCFDAHLYLMMNERRSVWKCPVCDGHATLSELFVDEYFQEILMKFANDDEITEVNVYPDGVFVAVAVKESRESKQHLGNIISNVAKAVDVKAVSDSSNDNSSESPPVILLESDDETTSDKKPQPSIDPSPTMNFSDCGSSCPRPEASMATSTATTTTPAQSDTGTTLTIDLTSDSESEDDSSSTATAVPAPLPAIAPAPLVVHAPTTAPIVVHAPTTAPIVVRVPSTAPIAVHPPSTAHLVVQAPTTTPLVVQAPAVAPARLFCVPRVAPPAHASARPLFPSAPWTHTPFSPPVAVLATAEPYIYPQHIKSDPSIGVETATRPQKASKKSRQPIAIEPPPGARRSSRLQGQDRKKYVDEDDDNDRASNGSAPQRRKRARNPLGDSESSSSTISNRKRRS